MVSADGPRPPPDHAERELVARGAPQVPRRRVLIGGTHPVGAGAEPHQMREWFSVGMFLNVMSAMDATNVKRAWVPELMGELLLKSQG